MISYRDHAYPNEEEMKALLGGLGRQAKLESTDHQYLISGQANEASKAKEYLFIAAPKPRAPKAACACERHCHTSLPVEIALRAQALDLGTARGSSRRCRWSATTPRASARSAASA
jgi:adenine-specific DNA-methyltransferase